MPYTDSDVPSQQAARPLTGVRHLEVSPEQAGQRLDNFVRRELGDLPKSRLYRVIRKGEVRVNGRRAGPETRLQAHDRVRLPPVREQPPEEIGKPPKALLETIAASIVFEDERLLVIDKPAGIAVHGGSGLSFGLIEALRALRPQESLELVHRLDRDTSGCLLVARGLAALREAHAVMREGGFDKRYLVLIRGKWELGRKRLELPLRTDLRVGGERTVRVDPTGKPSVSDFRPVRFFGRRATLVEVGLLTGRTHQIRVHAAHAGHPVAGDSKYGDPAFNLELRQLGFERMFLHAHRIGFRWPGGVEMSFDAPLPSSLAALVERLGEPGTARSG